MYRKSILLLVAASSILAVTPIIGCGSNQNDAFMRAAMRSRSDNNDTPPVAATDPAADVSAASNGSSAPDQTALVDATANVAGNQPPAAGPSGNDANPAPGAVPVATPIGSPGLSVTPIDQRRPAQSLDAAARMKRSMDNITQIGKAVRSYIDRTGFVPPHIIKTKAGADILSWRVAILPDLGYQDLYSEFDFEQPWDSPTNSKLLERIPDCFVSPERFDSSTNYQAIVGEGYVFRKLRLDRGSITDGLDNTLAFVEVDDRYAVPWTCPQDYEAPWETPTDQVGNLRPDGFFALWASGTPTLIRTNVDRIKMLNALTPDAGDGQFANAIHQSFLSISAASNTPSADGASTTMSATTAPSIAPSASSSGSTAGSPIGASLANLPRLPAPKDVIVRAALERVQTLYSGRFKDAKEVTERTAIATEMLDSAMLMREDPAGAYAMHDAVLSFATATGDFSLLTKALDGRAQMFEVDAIAENGKSLVEFAKANNGPIAAQIDHAELMRRCLPVIAESIRRDEYAVPIELVRHLLAMERLAKKRGNETGIPALRTQLNVAKDYLVQATDAIAILRSDESDPVSNGAVGRYTAFIKGDWRPGLEMLANGDNEKLAAMAKADLNVSTDPQRMLAVADAWYDLGKATANKVFRGGCYERAAYWYSTANDSLPESLAKLHAKTRLAESSDAAIGSPLAIIQRIADYSGFDLDREIELIKNPAVKAAQYDSSED